MRAATCHHLHKVACDVDIIVLRALQKRPHVVERALTTNVGMDTIYYAVQPRPIKIGRYCVVDESACDRFYIFSEQLHG